MLKKSILYIVAIMIIVVLSYYIYLELTSVQRSACKGLTQYASNLGKLIEREFEYFQDDLSYISSSENLLSYLQNPDFNIETGHRLKKFYERYRYLIHTIYIYDTEKTLKIFYSEDNHYIVSSSFINNRLSMTNTYRTQYDIVQYIHVFRNEEGAVIGNIEIMLDMEMFAVKKMSEFFGGQDYWIFLIYQNNVKQFYAKDNVFSDVSDIKILQAPLINDYVNARLIKTLQTSVFYNNKRYDVMGVIYPLSSLNLPYSIFVTLSKNSVYGSIIKTIIPISLLFLTVILIQTILFLKKKKKMDDLNLSVSENFIFFNNVIENLPVGMIKCKSENIITEINNELRKNLLIYFEDDFYLDKSTLTLKTEFIPIFKNLTANSYAPEIIHILRDNTELVFERFVIENFQEKDSFIIFLRDITAFYKTKHNFLEIQKSRFEFLGNISHELKTPITSIVNFTNILLQENLVPEKTAFLEQIIISAKKLMEVINNILNLSKLELNSVIVENIPVDVNSLFKPVIVEFTRLCEQKNIKFLYDFDSNLPFFLSDPLKISQIVYNILSNALKFTLSGTIKFNIYPILDFDQKTNIRFEVTDTGIGIEKQYQNDIFKPFSQSDTSITRKFGGAGLGLSISKKLTDLINGKIFLFKSDENGSCFIVDIPVKSSE